MSHLPGRRDPAKENAGYTYSSQEKKDRQAQMNRDVLCERSRSEQEQQRNRRPCNQQAQQDSGYTENEALQKGAANETGAGYAEGDLNRDFARPCIGCAIPRPRAPALASKLT